MLYILPVIAICFSFFFSYPTTQLPSYVIEGSHNEFCSFSYVLHTAVSLLDQYDKGEINGFEISYNNNGWFFDAQRGPNWWLYYFEPLQVMHKVPQNELLRIPNYMKFIRGTETLFEMSRERKHYLIQKYIRINPTMQEKLATIKQQFEDNIIIGIDYFSTILPSCNPEVTFEQLVTTAQQSIAQLTAQATYKIFLSTNDQACLDYMQQTFNDKLVCLQRLSNDQAPSQMAEIWLLNALILAQANILIDCGSSLARTAASFNLALPVMQLDINWYEKE